MDPNTQNSSFSSSVPCYGHHRANRINGLRLQNRPEIYPLYKEQPSKRIIIFQSNPKIGLMSVGNAENKTRVSGNQNNPQKTNGVLPLV